MRYALLPLLLLSGCTTLVPIADLGPCAAVTNARGCQANPYYIVWHESASTAQSDSSQKVGAAR